ncbi:hypothetical protein HELRODRAFT_163648 [Helobdella robusta]|uniref:Uncharacterized protein n=1 Tax=Helobdella robusta TaxID=6412 RepID=T1EUB4_HELRO|nr:hypothetical protein HELRODRAFT_163648 [Helobdella robusta]ESN96570.1 hypothetical protein HELRODRAFT_163648 [Helobdella robusta]
MPLQDSSYRDFHASVWEYNPCYGGFSTAVKCFSSFVYFSRHKFWLVIVDECFFLSQDYPFEKPTDYVAMKLWQSLLSDDGHYIEYIQKEYSCCGVEEYTDWYFIEKYNRSANLLPTSCCSMKVEMECKTSDNLYYKSLVI